MYCFSCGSGDVRLILLERVQKHLNVDLMDRKEASFDTRIYFIPALYVDSTRHDRGNISIEPIHQALQNFQRAQASFSAISGLRSKEVAREVAHVLVLALEG